MKAKATLWAVGVSALMTLGAGPVTRPGVAGTGRSRAEIGKDFSAAAKDLHEVLPDLGVLHDAAARERVGPRAVPVLKRLVGLMDELATAREQTVMEPGMAMRAMRLRRMTYEPTLVALGDEETTARLTKEAAGTDAEAARVAKADLVIAAYVAGDEAAGMKAVADYAALVKGTGGTDVAVDTAGALLAQRSGATAAVTEKMMAALDGPDAGDATKTMVRAARSADVLKQFEGKAVVIKGKTVEGSAFTSERWKGKVVLVDFWATWCGPCKEELPRVKKMYATYHDKGLEVVGVSNDQTAGALKAFVAKDPGMPWPQLFDQKAASEQEWNPETARFGIAGIPVMFLIDKKGVLRTVEARRDMEGMIPKLLAEE